MRIRHFIQMLWTILTNGYMVGFLQGKIYQGKLKQFCVPGLNCYSCPGALGACPIGALQALLGSWKYQFSFYVIGFIMAIGALWGRFVCGYLCPFGFFQDLLYKIPFPKKIKTFLWDKPLRWFKYIILLIFVFLLPMFVVDFVGQGSPYFCKILCPAGTLEGGIPLILINQGLQEAAGWLFTWKLFVLGLVILLSFMIYRPFCKYICPLGALYSLLNPIAIYRYQVDENRCTQCGSCADACKMNVVMYQQPNALECIHCGDCKAVCPQQAIMRGFYGSSLVFSKHKKGT